MKQAHQIQFILAAFIMSAASGCRNNQAGDGLPETEKHAVRRIVTEEIVRPVTTGDFNWPLLSLVEEKDILEYDAEGRIVRKVSYHTDRKWLKIFGPTYKATETQHTYNDHGKPDRIRQRIFDNEGKMISEYETRFEYDAEGMKTGMTKYHIDGNGSSRVILSEMSYYGEGRLRQRLTVIGNDTTYSAYTWKPDGTCLVNERSGHERSSYLIDGESRNLLELYAEDGTVRQKLEYRDGDLIRKTAGTRTWEYSYKRKYDKDNNCIRYSSYCNGRWVETIRRHIQTFKD